MMLTLKLPMKELVFLKQTRVKLPENYQKLIPYFALLIKTKRY